MRVLFLTAWYPHRYDSMAGLFVRKHAESVAQMVNVEVLYIYLDNHIQKKEFIEQQVGNVREMIGYVPKRRGFCATIRNNMAYFFALVQGLKRVHRPDVMQVNVICKSALVALWFKWRFKIPYLVVEHFSRYLPYNFNYKGYGNKLMSKIIVKNASCVLAVSKILAEQMQLLGLKNANYQLINNVVDDFFFQLQPKKKQGKKRILHISCFDETSKNICGILRAMKQVSCVRQDFEFVLVGTGIDFQEVFNYSKSLNFSEGMVQFVGEQTPREVCKWLYQSDFLVQFSNYETAGIVLSESLACGTPIISTPVGVAPEIINEENGILTPCKDEYLLSEKIIWMLDNVQNYDREAIRKCVDQFSKQQVGQQLTKHYKTIIGEL